MNYYFEVLKKYSVFSGRARRKEYWMFFLFSIIITIALGIIGGMIEIYPGIYVGLSANIYSLAVLIPSIAVGVRRMHDVNKSGWYLLIPIYGLILALRSGTVGNNKYGPDPKELMNQNSIKLPL